MGRGEEPTDSGGTHDAPPEELNPGPPEPTSVRAPSRERSAADWEVLIGGNWLNKLGALLLMIGLALFIGYSFTQLGPAGRIVVGFAASGAVLALGIVVERKAKLAMFARGLIGAGWSGLYFTTYAMHQLAEPPIVKDPTVAMCLLLVVAVGMIVHSLRYRSEALTGLAYFITFATVIIGPMSTFTVVALLPLTASLLYVALRFSWFSMAAFGAVATYGTYAVRYYYAGSAESVLEDPAAGQLVLAAYWLLFEGFDLVRTWKRGGDKGAAAAVFPLNAMGFLDLSVWQWWPGDANIFFHLCAFTAGAYLASAIVRAAIRPPSSFDKDADVSSRMMAGGYEGAITVAVGLATVALHYKFSGMALSIAWLVEFEVLFLAGVFLRQAYLLWLANLVLALPLARLLLVDLTGGGQTTIASREFVAWTPFAALAATVLYADRILAEFVWKGRPAYLVSVYCSAATFLTALAIWFEAPLQIQGIAFLLLTVPLLELGMLKRFEEFRPHAYLVGTLALTTLGMVNVLRVGVDTPPQPWLWYGLPALLTYALTAQMICLKRDRIAEMERVALLNVGSAAGTVLLALMMWHVLPTPLVAPGWGIMALLLIEIGFLLKAPVFRLEGNVMAAAMFVRLFLANFACAGHTLGISHRLLTVLPMMAVFYHLWARTAEEAREGRSIQAWEPKICRLYRYAPAVLGVFLIRFELGRVMAVYGWAVFGLGLLVAGVHLDDEDLRWQSYALAVLTFLRSWITNFYIPESMAGIFGRVMTGATVVACLYASEFISLRYREGEAPKQGNWLYRGLVRFDLHARIVFSLLATALLTMLLFYEVSGKVLTIAIGIEGTAILAMGFAGRERVLRLSGLGLLLFGIAKLLLYDVRELDTGSRILSFVGMGALLLGVSWLYAQFDKQLTE